MQEPADPPEEGNAAGPWSGRAKGEIVMSTIEVDAPDGRWLIDEELVRLIVRSWATSETVREYTIVPPPKRQSWLGPLIHSVETDWDRVRARVGPLTDSTVAQLLTHGLGHGFQRVRERLRGLEAETAHNHAFVQAKRRRAHESSMREIESAVSLGETAVDVAKAVRDVSAGLLVLGGTVLTGGAAAPLLGVTAGGAALQGAITFQDTRNVGAAIVSAKSNFTIGIIPGGRGAKQAVMLLVLQAKVAGTHETFAALLDGKSFGEALEKGFFSAATTGVSGTLGLALKGSAGTSALRRYLYPATSSIRYTSGRAPSISISAAAQASRTAEFTRGLVKETTMGVGSLAASRATAAAQARMRSALRSRQRTPGEESLPMVRDGRLVDQAVRRSPARRSSGF